MKHVVELCEDKPRRRLWNDDDRDVWSLIWSSEEHDDGLEVPAEDDPEVAA